jgi:MFS family permease
MADSPHATPTAAPADAPRMVPTWALLGVTWLNSLGSGILWSGVPFVAERQYGFSERQNLALALAESAVYVVVALRSGPMLRALGERTGLTPRAWLGAILVLQAAASVLALAGAWGVVVAGLVISAAGAAFWPVMESYVSSGRHGRSMRRALGAFNVTWMSATAVALLGMGPLVAAGHANLSLLALVPASLGAAAMLAAFPAAPAPHEPERAHAHLAPQYPYLLRATRWVLPTSYVFVSVLGPVLPYLVDGIGVDEGMRTPLASLWMFVRTATVVALAYLSFWHGRWGAVAAGVVLLAGGFAAAALAPDATTLALGLAAFGAGHGIIYSAGLYYAMAVGGAEVDAGGRFEALIGAGYVVGPLAGLVGARSPSMLVGMTVAAAVTGLVPAVRAWHAWRTRQLVP